MMETAGVRVEYSVLMSVYYKERPEYFSKSIDSMLSQTIRTNDFIIICDGPLTPELDEVIEIFTKKYDFFQIVRLAECSGLGKALNEGLKYCKNEIIARMDSDDISLKERMELQLDIMNEMKADIVGGTVEEFDQDPELVHGVRKMPQTNESIRKFARKRNPFNHPSVVFRKDTVLKVGGYMDCPFFEDYHLWVRMLQSGAKGYNIQSPVVKMRSGNSMYERRGGLAYAKKAVAFRWHIKKIGFSTWRDFIVSAGTQLVVCLMPNKLRILFYRIILRK